MGSKGSSSSSFTPPPEVVEAYKEALGYGRAAMGQQYQPYTGEITAPLTPTQESGIYNVNRAVGTAIPYFGQATGLTADVAGRQITPQQFSQEAIQQYQSPYTQAVANATFANLREQQKQEQEGLQSGAIRAGAFGGDRAGIAAANLARQQELATAQAMSNIYNQGYGQAVGLFGQQQGVNLQADQANAARQLQAAQQLAGLGTGLQGSVLQGAQAQLAAGAQQQAVQQAINSGYYNQYLGAQAYPYQQAQFFANLATGVGGQMGGTTTGTPAQPSPVGSIFGALGALGSIMSDKRAKENIRPIGKTNDGQTIYRFNYKGDDVTQIGLLAQEVEKKHPEAVTTINGLKGVDYKEATDDSVRSMGGGVVPSSTRHNFALGGPSINEEEDSMIPYKAGVPSKVLQIPKLAKIGGTKPNFGGTPPGPVQGPSSQDFKGAAEGLGKLAKKYDLFGSKETTPDSDSVIAGISDWLKANGGPVYPRPRFENGEEVPVTADTKTLAFNPDRDRADIVRPSYDPDVDRVEPMRVASLGDVARSVDAGVPSSEPVREAARPQGGVVPSIARSNTDLPPLFQAAAEAVAQEPEEKQPVSVPSMARADTNVQPVQPVQPGVAPAQAPKAAQSNPTIEMIKRKANELGLPPNIAVGLAGGESSFDPNAKAKTSSASGLFQITKGTMKDLGGDYSRVNDPEYNAHYGILYGLKNYRQLTSPDDPNAPAKVMMGHFFGTDGAKGILRNPDAPISQTLSNYDEAIAANPGVKFKGKPLAAWTGRDAQEWAAAKMAANYEPGEGGGLGRVRVASADGKTATDAGDRKWNFGMAGEGKRSVIESIMDRDFDPIQKRALFSFFAGMAASPSPWFGQQLGAGMQAASNVYNESLNKQAELDVKGQEIGLQKERVGLEERRVGVEEKAKGLELLKFWQTRFIPQPTDKPGVFEYYDTTTGDTITAEKYNGEIANIMKQYGLSKDAAPQRTAPGLGGVGGAGAPTGGLVPPVVQPSSPVDAKPKTMPGAEPSTTAPATAAPMTMPPEALKPSAPAPSQPQPEAKEKPPANVNVSQQDFNQLNTAQRSELKQYENVAPGFIPALLDLEAERLRREGDNALKIRSPNAQVFFDRAKERSDKAKAIRNGDLSVQYTDGRPDAPIQSALDTKRRIESEQKFSEQNLKDNMEWRKEAGPQLQKMPKEIQTLDGLAKVLENYKPDLLGEQKTKFMQFAESVGISVPESAMKNADEFYKFIKYSTDLVYDRLEKIGGRILQTEVLGITAAMPGATMTPEAARSLVAKMKGAAEYTRQYYRDLVKEVPTGPQLAQFDKDKWIDKWTNENSLKEYIDVYDKEIAVRGGTPQQARDLEYGRSYILNPGEWNNNYDRPTKVKFLGFKKDEKGGFGPYFEPERRK